MSAFSKLLKDLRVSRKLSKRDIANRAGVSENLIYKWENGSRVPTGDRGETLRTLLCSSSDEHEIFVRELEHAKSPSFRNSPTRAPIDSQKSSYRIIPVPYYPLSGADDAFSERFLKRMFQLAVIRYEESEVFDLQQQASSFDVSERINAVCDGRADLLVNLSSLQRAKKIAFFNTPIQISVNAVIPAHRADAMTAATEFVSFPSVQPDHPFRVIAIKNEVGWVHATQTLHIPTNRILTQRSLSPRRLADALRQSSKEATTPILICDELTALNVVAELKGEGMLVLAPTTVEAVRLSPKRRNMPNHPLGFGFNRQDLALRDFLTESFESFLRLERETISALYEDLYQQLVLHVRGCLFHDHSLYIGGVRRITRKGLNKRDHETLLDQNARSYAKRALSLSRQAEEERHTSMDRWYPILIRARERVQTSEARNRRIVKATLVAALKTVLGIDPADTKTDVSQEQFETALTDLKSELQFILERELDARIALDTERISGRPLARSSLESVVSWLQRVLEASSQTANVTALVDPVRVKGELLRRLEKRATEEWALHAVERTTKVPSITIDHECNATGKDLIALNLGEPVGFIKTAHHFSGKDAWTLEIKWIYVDDHLRKAGVSHRLIRAVVDYADQYRKGHSDSRIELVWLVINNLPGRLRQLFLDSGFEQLLDRFVYRLDRLSQNEQLDRRSRRPASKTSIAPSSLA
jgi:transcriptional regulator with XRE-family HTH domain/GNAT superfamily N-acetyltransferase